MKSSFLFLLFAFVAFTLADQRVRRDGHKLVKVSVDRDMAIWLNSLELTGEVQFWEPEYLPKPSPTIETTILVSPEVYERVISLADHKVVVEDIQAVIDEVEELNQKARNVTDADWYSAYHTRDEIVEHLSLIAKQYANLATFVPSIGKTLEGRDIPAITFTGTKAGTKRRFYFQSGQHAREWIGPATALYIIENLLKGYGTDKEITNLLDQLEFVAVPQINGDGYVYSWSKDRLWRKNRRPNSGGSYGVDLNRNWDDHFGGAGTSKTPSSDTYCGPSAFSEPETKVVSAYVKKFTNIIAGIDYHSYSQLILRPYGWTKDPSPDEKVLKALGDGTRDAIKSVHSVSYTSEASWELYYTTGSAQDWFYGQANFWGFTIELRDTGRYGFTLPPEQIIPTGQENLKGFLYFAKYVLEKR